MTVVIVQGKNLDVKLRIFREAIKDREEPHRRAGTDTLRDTRRDFLAARDPDGRGWKELSPITIARKGHARILQDTGQLLKSLQFRTRETPSRNLFTTTMDTGTNRRDIKLLNVHQKTRPILGFNRQDIQSTDRIFLNFVDRAIRRL